jgi:hypothetical protein
MVARTSNGRPLCSSAALHIGALHNDLLRQWGMELEAGVSTEPGVRRH